MGAVTASTKDKASGQERHFQKVSLQANEVMTHKSDRKTFSYYLTDKRNSLMFVERSAGSYETISSLFKGANSSPSVKGCPATLRANAKQ